MAVGMNAALGAYQQALDRSRAATERNLGTSEAKGPDAVSDFTAALRQAAGGVAEDLKAGEAATIKAAAGQADVNEVVLAISKAELALQTMTTVRDKALQAYQEIMRMPI